MFEDRFFPLHPSPSAAQLRREEELEERAAETRVYMEEVAKVHAAWVKVRDEYARLCRLHGVDEAAALEDCHSWLCDAATNLQGAIERR